MLLLKYRNKSKLKQYSAENINISLNFLYNSYRNVE